MLTQFQRTGGRRKEKKVLVPETKQPLFDSLSKTKLIPGTEVRQSVADDTWLIQKHRDIVQDFIDVDAAEKDYIIQWDAFIQKRRISSDAFISRAVLEFVNEKMQWLLSSHSRIQEFGKHLTVLIARGLDDDTVRQVQSRIQEARSQKPPETEQVPAQQYSKDAQHRSSKGCAVCGRNVRGPQLLICSNEVSTEINEPMPASANCGIYRVARNLCTTRTASGTKRKFRASSKIGGVVTVHLRKPVMGNG